MLILGGGVLVTEPITKHTLREKRFILVMVSKHHGGERSVEQFSPRVWECMVEVLPIVMEPENRENVTGERGWI